MPNTHFLTHTYSHTRTRTRTCTCTLPSPSVAARLLPSRRFFFATLIALLLTLVLSACAQNPSEPYRPTQAQHGKDVIWMPTDDPLVLAMLDMAGVNAGDTVYDLGAGDGRIAIEAARVYGATAVGIEYNPDLAEFARLNVKQAGLEDKVTIITGDIFEEEFSNATVVTLYLLESLNIRLKPTLLKMEPGTRVVSNSFGMGLWIPDDAVQAAHGTVGKLWIVPAQIAGRWQVSGLPGLQSNTSTVPSELNLRQSFQFVDGQLTQPHGRPIRVEGRLRGEILTLTYTDLNQQPQTLTLNVDQTQWQKVDDNSSAPVARRIPS